jgi:small conductance mechanosensitive channel
MPPLVAKDLVVDLAIRYGFQVLGALVILLAGLLVARWLGQLTGRWLERQHVEPPARALAVRAVRVVIVLFALVLALDKFGFQVAPLVAGIGVAGLGVGFALQGVLSNVLAGLTIVFTKPYRLGEWIRVVGVHGQVEAIELFSTTLVHPDRSRVVIPNRKIVGEILHNFGAIRQLTLTVPVAAATDLGRALGAAREVLAQSPRVLRDPEPIVGVRAVRDPALAIGIGAWVAVPDYVGARAELYRTLVERFRAEGVELARPERQVRLLAAS